MAHIKEEILMYIKKQLIILLIVSIFILSGCGSKTIETQENTIIEEESLANAPAEDSPQETTNSLPETTPNEKSEDENANSSEAEIIPSETDDSSEENQPTDEPDISFIENYDNEIVVSSTTLLERFINGYKISLAPQSWTIADFDENGAIMATTSVTDKSTNISQTAIVVLTPIMEGDKMTGATPHFVSVGDTVYGDDGYCDEFFSNLEEFFNSY